MSRAILWMFRARVQIVLCANHLFPSKVALLTVQRLGLNPRSLVARPTPLPLPHQATPVNSAASVSAQTINQTFIVHPKVHQRAGQPSLLHLGIIKTEKIELKCKTDEQISQVNGLEP